jgi:hypothetical protein
MVFENPLIIKFFGPIIGLVLPTDNDSYDIFWTDGVTQENVSFNYLNDFTKIKENLTEQEVCAWRLKHGV